jgi:hypothetical protein
MTILTPLTGIRRHLSVGLLLVGFMINIVALPAMAQEPAYRRVYDANLRQYVYVREGYTVREKARSALSNPVIRNTAIGAGAGALTGILSKRSVAKGLGIGAAAGAVTGIIGTSRTLDNHPHLKSSLTGAAVGTGASIITERNAWKGAGVGAGLGLGASAINQYLNNR